MKIEIASGAKPHKGYKTVDIRPEVNPDIVGDFRTMSFSDIEVIRAHHILEHFGRDEGEAVLRLWHSWLMKDGILVVETPDFEEICKNFAVDKYWMTRHTFGSQEGDWAFHKDGWYEDKFREILPKLGFEILDVVRNKTRAILPNITVSAKKVCDGINNEYHWNKVWNKFRKDDDKQYLKEMFDGSNTPEYWDNMWSRPKRRVEKYSMQRTWWLIQEKGAKSVLEAGCGNGRLLFGIKDKVDKVYGIDLSETAIKRMKAEYDVDGMAMNVYDIDKVEGKWDFIVANHLLEHLTKDEEFIQKCKDKLNDGGTFCCSVPNDMSFPEETGEHVRKYNSEQLEQLLTKVFGNATMEVIGNHLIAYADNIPHNS